MIEVKTEAKAQVPVTQSGSIDLAAINNEQKPSAPLNV
jgi:hypothetical protein